MKNFDKCHLYMFTVLIFFAGCKLDSVVLPSGSSPAQVGSTSYQPVTAGSYWKYNYISNGVTDTLTTTISGATAFVYGTTYYESDSQFKLHHFPDKATYLSNTGHIYNELSISGQDTVNTYYLNDTTALNVTWFGTINGSGSLQGVPARFDGQIVEKNINLTVGGTTYTGVTHSKVYLQYNYGQGFKSYITYDYFVVSGIGIIELFFTGPGVSGSEALISYSIKKSTTNG